MQSTKTVFYHIGIRTSYFPVDSSMTLLESARQASLPRG
eukprot:CCRYP_006425-RA/>CCRYP_006425-RA protein AED:0.46 eAED:0.56 QI:0/-1/0/1/-1/0/1/0/38